MRTGRRKTSTDDSGRAGANAAKRTSSMEPALCNGTALRKATRRVSQLYDAVLAPCGLRSTQRSILIHIARAGMPAMGDLASALVLDRSALAHSLKPLEREGLVTVVVDPNDKRSRLIKLTQLGEATLRESMNLWKQAQHRFESAYGAEPASRLRASLALIASAEFAEAFQIGKRAPGRTPRS